MLARPGSPLRRWLGVTRASVRQHRRLVVATVLGLYAVFGLGVLAGTTLPDSCDVAVVEIVEGAITALGATAAYGSGDVPRAAGAGRRGGRRRRRGGGRGRGRARRAAPPGRPRRRRPPPGRCRPPRPLPPPPPARAHAAPRRPCRAPPPHPPKLTSELGPRQ